jgi:hypothetical protein
MVTALSEREQHRGGIKRSPSPRRGEGWGEGARAIALREEPRIPPAISADRHSIQVDDIVVIVQDLELEVILERRSAGPRSPGIGPVQPRGRERRDLVQ